jgi:DNA mismatch repair protein MutH
MTVLPYDQTDAISIEQYAKKLENKTFRQVLPDDISVQIGNKGGLGQLLEEFYFLYKPNSTAGADFDEAGLELKVTPIKQNANKTYSAKERLVLNIINYHNLVNETFETSAFWNKNNLLLLILYLYKHDLNRLDYLITNARLFHFPEKDLKIIRDDWKKIKSKVIEGKAHELSESDTNYLSAATKGASKESVREQPYSEIPAKQRAYSLKSSYMTYILREYVLQNKPTYQPIAEDYDQLTMEEYVLHKLNAYKGQTLGQLIEHYKIDAKPNSKHITYLLATKIVNQNLVDLSKSEEFLKANIKVKAIRIAKNGKIREHMSFPTFKYTEIVQEEWETSTLREMFLDTRYLFIVFRELEDGQLTLDRALFWNLPYQDLEGDVRKVWEETVRRINNGQADQLPRKTEFNISHIRPHARDSRDTYPTPYGTDEVKKCFWLNNDYILEQIIKNS